MNQIDSFPEDRFDSTPGRMQWLEDLGLEGIEVPPRASTALFPLLPGESIYSACARNAHVSGRDGKAASELLLGHRYGARHHHVVFGLRRLEHVYGGGVLFDELAVRTRTVLGAVLPFLPPPQREILMQAVRGPAPFRPLRHLSVLAGNGGHGLVLRRCPDCAEADCRQVHFAYWHAVHQFAGVWVCPWHGRPLQWLTTPSMKTRTWSLAHRSNADFQELNVTARQLDVLHRIAVSVLWCATYWSIGTAALAVMVRSRLHTAGFVRQEGFVSEDEQQRIHQTVAAPLIAGCIPHYAIFEAAGWVGKTLTVPEFSHPLRWAALIAATLSPWLSEGCALSEAQSSDCSENLLRRFYGVALPTCLDCDYAACQQRVAQRELFADRRGARRGLAPPELYEALGSGRRLADAAPVVGLTVGQVSSWLRKDDQLSRYWHDSIALARTAQARARLEQYVREHPSASRSCVLRAEVAAVRALERYAPGDLNELLPSVQDKFSLQRRLPF